MMLQALLLYCLMGGLLGMLAALSSGKLLRSLLPRAHTQCIP